MSMNLEALFGSRRGDVVEDGLISVHLTEGVLLNAKVIPLFCPYEVNLVHSA